MSKMSKPKKAGLAADDAVHKFRYRNASTTAAVAASNTAASKR